MKRSLSGSKTFIDDMDAVHHEEPPFLRPSCSETKRGYSIYHFWLTDEIEEPFKYDDWYRVCDSAVSEDIIVVHLNSPGGILDSAIQIYDALRKTSAGVVVKIEGGCCSGASMIAMAADELEMSPLGYMMIHSMSGGTGGKLGNMVENAEFHKKWFSKVMHVVYGNFCTKSEIDSILEGKDLWLDADEVLERFSHIKEVRMNSAEKINQKRKTVREKIDRLLEQKGLSLEEIL